MSEARKSKASKTKSETAPKAKSESVSETKAETKAKDGAEGTPAAPATPSDAKGSEAAGEGVKEGGKSARDSIGGKSDVHYGYFSSVRTPAYRSGWDAIWGGNNGDGATDDDQSPRQRRQPARRTAKARKRRDPITVTLDLDDLPPPLKDGLVEIARAELRKSRVSYERRSKAGAIDWRITCRVD